MVKETAECQRKDKAGCLVRLRSKRSRKLKACLSLLNTFVSVPFSGVGHKVLSNLAVPPRTMVPVSSWLITNGSLHMYLCNYSVKKQKTLLASILRIEKQDSEKETKKFPF